MKELLRHLCFAVFAGVGITSAPLWAQNTDPSEESATADPDAPRWFQVEVAIFRQQQPTGQHQEHWRQDIALAYPPHWIELRSPQAFEKEALAHLQAKAEADRQLQEVLPADDQQTNPIAPPAKMESYTLDDVRVDLEREPYFFLPRQERQLTQEVRALRRDKRYQVLFHQAWRQPVVEYDKAPALLIHGGNQFGEHFELSGSLTLSVSRYLHLKTNLWLSEFVANYGQERLDWPELPARPSLNKQEGYSLLFDQPEQGLWSQFSSGNEEYSSILAQPYLPKQVVLLEQKRRMRSTELHYIDHPLLGLLVKITRYELPPQEEPDGESPIDSMPPEDTLGDTETKTPA